MVLGSASLVAPPKAREFLLGFAGSARKHYAELAFRFAVGAAFVVHAPQMQFPQVFEVFGWIVLGTTTGLLLIPWRWHHRFALRAVPTALRLLPLIGVSSTALGVLILLAALRGGAA